MRMVKVFFKAEVHSPSPNTTTGIYQNGCPEVRSDLLIKLFFIRKFMRTSSHNFVKKIVI